MRIGKNSIENLTHSLVNSNGCLVLESDAGNRSVCYLLSAVRTAISVYSTVLQKESPYSIIECRVPELVTVLGSQPAGDVSHKPGDRLPLLSARPAVTLATLKRAATNFAAW